MSRITETAGVSGEVPSLRPSTRRIASAQVQGASTASLCRKMTCVARAKRQCCRKESVRKAQGRCKEEAKTVSRVPTSNALYALYAIERIVRVDL